MVDYEYAKLSYSMDKEKYLNKSINLLKEAKEVDKNYLLAIENANNIQKKYITSGKMTLQYFQTLDQELIEYSQDCMRKFFIFNNTGLKSILEDNYTMQKIIEKVSMKNDIDEYIISHTTNKHPPSDIQYTPYKISIRNKLEDQSLDSEAVFNVISALYNTLDKIDGEQVYYSK
jgi:hypothetical protein